MSLWKIFLFRRWARRNRVMFIHAGPSKDCQRRTVECAGRVS